MKIICRVALLTVLFGIGFVTAPAQTGAAVFGTGIYPLSTQDTYGIDTINVGNNNIHLNIPIISKPGRGLPFQYSLTFDSGLVWAPALTGSTYVWSPDVTFGFRGDIMNVVAGSLTYDETFARIGSCTFFSNFVYVDALDVPHPFTYSNGCAGPSGSTTASDGSGYVITSFIITDNNSPPTSIITSPTGRTLYVPDVVNSELISTPVLVADSNGNEISATSTGVYTDTTGTVELTTGGMGTSSSPRTFQYPTATSTATATITYTTQMVQTAFNCSGVTEYGPLSVSLPSSLVLGDGTTTYLFNYEATPGVTGNVTGRLQSITLPGGGTITYAYSGGPCTGGINPTGTTPTLTRTTADGTTTYATVANGSTASITTKTDALNSNKSVYWFSNLSGGTPYETHRQIWEGPVLATVGPTTLVEHFTCYNGHATPCDGQGGVTTTTGFTPTSSVVTVAYNGGLQAKTSTSYNGFEPMSIATGDYGGGTAVLSTTYYLYASPSELTQVNSTDSSNTLYAKTTYGYDGASVTASGAPQLMTPTGARGNQTSMGVVYDSAYDSIGIETTYYDSGLPKSITGPPYSASDAIQYTYDSTAQTFPTGVTLPTPSSGVSLATSAMYNAAAGTASYTKDYNANQTNYAAYNNLMQPTSISYPDGGLTTITYAPTVNAPTTTTWTIKLSGSSNAQKVTFYDGYGRAAHVGVLSQGSTWYWNDYCYNANGWLSQMTYAHTGTSTPSTGCSGNGDAYTYDAMGRLILTTHADLTTATTTYFQRDVETISESGRRVITQYDGLARPTVVCEVTSITLANSGAPASCGLDIPATVYISGYTTQYAYSLANHQTTITHGAQTRTIQTDWAGRTISIKEPEMIAEGQAGGSQGTTTFAYTYNTTGLAVTRTKPKANQASATVLTTTTTQYDILGRIVSVTYSDGTPTRTFTYDAAPSGWNAATYLKGQLSGTTRTLSMGRAANAYSYDAMGRIASVQECVPSGCGNSAYIQSIPYSYDYGGNLTGAGDGRGGTIVYVLSQAGEITSIKDPNGSLPSHPVYSIANGPNGPLSFNLGNGLTGAYSYDALGRVNGSSICNGGTPMVGCGGSAYQMYGYSVNWQGIRATGSTDTVLGATSTTYGYGDMDQLTAVNNPSQTSYNFTYDRWGNRTTQSCTGTGSCPQPSYTFDTATNHNTSTSVYDAAGNLTYDGFHHYTYDADGNVTNVDSGTTATYSYDSLNERIRVDLPTASNSREFVFDQNGKRLAIWDTTHDLLTTTVYWGAAPLAFTQGGTLHLEHQDWTGTERMRTSQTGGVEGTYTSLPYGDAYQYTGADNDAYHYAQLDMDTDTNSHATFREYSSNQGRWMSMDPYYGSYNIGDPQSFNRYSYALNNPVHFVDPLGLNICYYGSAGDEGTDTDESDWSQDSPEDCAAGGGVILTAMQSVDVSGNSDDPLPPNPIVIGTLVPLRPAQGTAPSNCPGCSNPHQTPQQCATDIANHWSIAGLLPGAPGTGSSFGGGFIGGLLGNNITNITGIYNTVFNSGSPSSTAGNITGAGAGLGMGSSVGMKGPVSAIIGQIGPRALGELLDAAALPKWILDGAIYGEALSYCKTGKY